MRHDRVVSRYVIPIGIEQVDSWSIGTRVLGRHMSGLRPLAQALYRMTPLELIELRKQLTELLDVGLVHPSKAVYGALVLS